MKKLLFGLFIFLNLLLTPASYASHIDIKPCIKTSHCVIEEWDVSEINNPFTIVKTIIKENPRTEIVDIDGDYLHAEVTSRIMKYVDDLEVSYLIDKNHLIIRSESRVGDGDFGVNQKRVDLIKSLIFS
tara:strand:- start:727 stop:1113 length:387 start_codon:yes stop_codon:yes gene_type:complete